jgi:phage terminase large subunit
MEIIIDDVRCPETAREFLNYELEKDANGNFKAEFPDKNNHSIDAVRYALNTECMKWREEQTQKKKKDPFGIDKKDPPMIGGKVTESFFKGGW